MAPPNPFAAERQGELVTLAPESWSQKARGPQLRFGLSQGESTKVHAPAGCHAGSSSLSWLVEGTPMCSCVT